MSIDLTKLLQDWPYEPGQINVRLIRGDDGEPKIQMRLDLGVLQMEVTGRPDGLRPNDFDSLLELHESRIADHEEAGGPEGDGDPPVLSEDDCRLLREEAVQFYHRYISLLVLSDYEGVVRDTTRNLRVLDLCKQYAESEEDRTVLEQFRPYITMMRMRALASQMVVGGEPKAALFLIDEGVDQIRRQYDDMGRAAEFEEASEVQLLRGMRDELVTKLPASQKHELHERLKRALEQENYELAAILRDELKMLKDDARPEGP
ncbi:MAG: UvrB/UvrC motif-containing protein [Planctomycetota bacterium]|nr:UvrB/UvrC motif-containing protein [Planctomycetota bacterium]